MHTGAMWALSATGMPRAGKTLRVSGGVRGNTATPVRDLRGHTAAGRNVPAQVLVGIYDAEAGATRCRKHWDPAAVLLANL